VRVIQSRLSGLSQAEVAARLSAAISELDKQKVDDFNQAISSYARRNGIRMPNSGGSVSTPETALMLAGMLKGGTGMTGFISLLKDPRIAAVVIPVLRRTLRT
jgi:hypothetical protein